uniref:Uncharacterized protein n=1 Tax=Romanomermis culicivorax TaxID=13658 RepID=A0A915KSU9_ROMCU
MVRRIIGSMDLMTREMILIPKSEEDILRTQELLKKDCTNGISSTPCSTPNLSQDYLTSF